jgi:hypothetical protein
MSAEMYGYGSSSTASRKKTRTFDAVKTYTNLAIDAVNKESLKEVDKNTPGNEATTVKEEVGSGPTTPAATQAPVATNPVVTAPVIPPVVPPVVPPVTPPANQYQLPTPSNEMDWAPGVTKIQNDIKNFYPESRRYSGVGLMGSSDYYAYNNQLGKWQYIPGDGESTVFKDVKDQSLIDRLDKGDAKTLDAFTIKDKPGYYYRKRMDGSFAKYKGDPKKHNSSTRPIAYITKKDKSYNYLDNKYWFENEGTTVLNYKQQGGFVTDPFNNPMEPLQRFVGGGYDPSINDLSENQIQYMDSKDVTDAYMQGGGFIKNFIPANLTRSRQNDVVQRIYNPVTGETRQGGPGAGNYLSAIDVRKSGITGTPKKYTIYYGSEGDPRYENLISLDGAKGKDTKSTQRSQKQQALENAGYGDRTDVTGLKGKSKRAIRQGERKRDRELKKLYEEDPTNVEFTAIDQNAPFDYTQPKPELSAQDYLTTSWGDVRGDLNSDLQTNLDEFLKTDPTPEQIDDKVAELLDQRSRDMAPDPSFFASPEQEKINRESLQRNPMMMGFNRGPATTQENVIEGNNVTEESDVVQGNDIIQEGDSSLPKVDIPAANIPTALPEVPVTNPEDIDMDPNSAAEMEFERQLLDQGSYYPDMAFQDYMSTVGPMSNETDSIVPFEEQYMVGQQPYNPDEALVTPGMIDYNFIQNPEAAYEARLQELNPMIDMGAWSGTAYPADILQPGVNPFELPVGGGEYYYPPFAQPTAPVPSRNNQPTNRPAPSGPSLDQLRAQQRRNPNAGKDYTFKPNMAGMKKDPDYVRAMQNARKDGIVTNQEAENASRIFKQKQAEQEKAKVADQAQRTINQIMNSSASTAEKNKAREKVVLQMEQRWDEIDRVANSRKYGGALSKFVGGGNNQPFTGESPIAYTNNPMMQGKSDLDLISLNSGIQGAQGQVNWGAMSSQGIVNQKNDDGSVSYGVDATYKGPQAPEIKIDPMQQEEFQVAKTYSEPLAIDVKNKLSQGEREARLIAGNSLMRGVAGFKNRRDDTKQMEGFYDNLTADNLYASDPSRDRGDYAESGLYRPDEQGQTWYGRSAQMGGYVDDDFEDGEEVYMTDEEIKEYMANGGQIQFI